MRLSRWAGAACAAFVVAAGAFAPRASAQGMDPDQERARQLVVRIRRSMREMLSSVPAGGCVRLSPSDLLP